MQISSSHIGQPPAVPAPIPGEAAVLPAPEFFEPLSSEYESDYSGESVDSPLDFGWSVGPSAPFVPVVPLLVPGSQPVDPEAPVLEGTPVGVLVSTSAVS